MIKAMIKKGIVLAGIACIPTAVSMGEFTCRMCTYKCHERKTMIRHLLHKHRVLQCLECGYASKSYNKYQEHLLVKHGKLDCPNCADRTFNSQENFNSIRRFDMRKKVISMYATIMSAVEGDSRLSNGW